MRHTYTKARIKCGIVTGTFRRGNLKYKIIGTSTADSRLLWYYNSILRSHLKMRHSDRLKHIQGIRTAEILIQGMNSGSNKVYMLVPNLKNCLDQNGAAPYAFRYPNWYGALPILVRGSSFIFSLWGRQKLRDSTFSPFTPYSSLTLSTHSP